MKIFLSYSSKQQDLAEQIFLELGQSGHSVFFDKKSLQAGGNFRKKIRNELDQSEVFVFLITPDSVTPKCFALSELDIARQKWPQPEAHILPVMAIATDLKSVPAYLKAVTILDPEGEIVEAISRRLDDWSWLEEVDIVESARKHLEEVDVPSLAKELISVGAAIGSFKMEVIERGKPNQSYRRWIDGYIKIEGENYQLIPKRTEYTATAGREYEDDQGRTCRELTLTYRCDGEWITQINVFYLQRGKWLLDQPA